MNNLTYELDTSFSIWEQGKINLQIVPETQLIHPIQMCSHLNFKMAADFTNLSQ